MIVSGIAFWICAFLIQVTNSSISYSFNGSWINSPNSDDDCTHFRCSPHNLTWIPEVKSGMKYYNNVTACDALRKKGITKVLFHGDSYMRHMYAALLITLKGDYRYGSQADPKLTPRCEYKHQFYEKECNTYKMNHYGLVCDGQILLDPILNEFNKLDHCKGSNGTVVLWSFGNHRAHCHRYGRVGINNATEMQSCFETDICKELKTHEHDGKYSPIVSANNSCSIWWISTHFRMKGWFGDETYDKVKVYNEDMRQYFDSNRCGHVNYIDVYNMTARLGIDHPSEAEAMTFDSVHWGMEVNLVKAQIIINALLS